MAERFTILGSSGFIGSHLVRHLRAQGFDIHTPARDAADLRGQPLGHVIYAIGLTGNFRENPDATADAHVTTLTRLLDGAKFSSWLYLSSTRLYGNLAPGQSASEEAVLEMGSADIYDRSKLQGEDICLSAHPHARVARLSNVYGPGQSAHTFLGAVLQEAVATGSVTLRESPQSAKDYIAIGDVVRFLQEIAMHGSQNLYNVASGTNVTHAALAASIAALGYEIRCAEHAPTRAFPAIDTRRLNAEFGKATGSVTNAMNDLLAAAKQAK